ncbi:MAG TPA: hypothetical protein PKI14_01425 [Fervidobacterium sp.]|nr:hypothetical protein [Fervidobacterium sp.]
MKNIQLDLQETLSDLKKNMLNSLHTKVNPIVIELKIFLLIGIRLYDTVDDMVFKDVKNKEKV